MFLSLKYPLNKGKLLTGLAKETVENYIKEGKIISSKARNKVLAGGEVLISSPENLPADSLKRRAGVFVTIEKEGQLRGCIGTYLPTKENIATEIISNAIAAATEDYRFGPIKKEELPYLSYTVYILGKPELLKDISELDPKKFGIIVKTSPVSCPNGKEVVLNGHFVPKSGLLLPDLDGINTPEKQISIACQKGGINSEKEKILIYRFTAEKYETL